MDAPRHPEAMIRMDLCRGALNVGDLALAAAEARAARELCRALGSRRGVMECDQLLALVPFHAQRWSEAADRLRTLLERVGATELDLQATVCMNLAAALAGAGRFDEALAVTDRGSRVSAELGIASYVSLGVVRRYLLAGGPTPEAGAIRELTDDEHSWREAAIRYGRPDIVERIDLVLAAAGSRG